ncbi:response regulator transcription factor [Streptomyces rubellomurinus]|uniref:Response regulator transcription factor n=1 Tax=Streptomyces sp. Y1 TaxID=3238634 RepID=A0AB39TKN3_9ACTN|nr:response regulator transcription factor [Streptomyces rubellomurinus]
MTDPETGGAAELTPDATVLYEQALRDGVLIAADRRDGLPPERFDAALAALLELRLLHGTGPGRWVPASPEAAVAELVGPLEQEIHERRMRAERTRAMLLPLQSTYFEARRDRGRGVAIELLHDVEQVRSMLSEVSRACSEEVFVSQPTALSEETLVDSRPRDLQLLDRGVRMRALYPHVVLASPVVQMHFTRMSEAGSEIRTVGEVIDRLIIFDRRIAFLPDRTQDGEPGAMVIREPVVVEYLYRTMEREWSQARPFTHTGFGYGDSGDEVKRGIVRLLAAGHKDEAIAHRMNMSVRTCRRHIAELMRDWGVDSRFQAGVFASRFALIDR